MREGISSFIGTVLLASLIACGGSKEGGSNVYQGLLTELIAGDYIFYKDYHTAYIHNIRIVPGDDQIIYLSTGLPDYSGLAVKFFDLNDNEQIHQIVLPNEGPESIKGGGGGHIYVSSSEELFLFGSAARIGKYDKKGKKIFELETDFILPHNSEDFIQMESRKGLTYMEGNWIQVGQNPSNPIKFYDPKERLAKSEFPLDFSTWLSQINVNTGEVRHTDFRIPVGYEEFQNDLTATFLMGAFNPNDGQYFLGWPYSDTVYRLKGLNLIGKFSPKSSIAYTYLPSEIIPVGETATAWQLPKQASAHIFLLYDESKNLFVRMSKTHESGVGETQFERTKHYVLSVYSSDWDSLGDYFIDFEGPISLENWFLNSDGLFINKPAQSNEDEYGFFRIDLSKVKK